MTITEKNIGTRIETVEELVQLAIDKKSVYRKSQHDRIPAGWIANFPAATVVNLINKNELYNYIPNEKNKSLFGKKQ